MIESQSIKSGKMESNGLKYDKIKSKVTPFDKIESHQDLLKNAPQNGWFIAYLYHRVVIGRIKEGTLVYYKDHDNDVQLENLFKIRIFNNEREFFAWRTGQKEFKGRLREDHKGTDQEVVDAFQIMFGTKAEPLDGASGYSKITEDRGAEIILPLAEMGINDSDINNMDGRLCVHTRNYIGEITETGQATFEDVRFLEFIKYKEIG